ncbi:MAG: hypothetical protein AB6733_06210 [Clostridiaceae bacterium]
MIIGNDELYVNGNTVLKPNRVQYEKQNNEQYEKLKKQQKQLKRKEEKEAKIKKVKVISLILLAFVLGFTVVLRYSLIYSVQKEYVEARQGIAQLNKENESLQINLIKLEDNQDVKAKIASLKMVSPNKNTCVNVDLNKEVFNEKKENKTEEGVLSYIKQLIF